MMHDCAVAYASEVQVVGENGGHHRSYAERDDRPRVRPHAPEQTIICADTEQVIRYADYGRFRPLRGGATPASGPPDEASRLTFGNRLGAGLIPLPVHLANEVRQNQIRPGGVEEKHL